ncbi:hypothetical protein PRZ48_000399 [Zasmidium cellare]|uniref:Geranylgeranyl diphosphate synthase n=1 Tax=Zasmidium cellare TaxID=395010 RepID=A0ABR0EYE1_ZASCE|nr:hypothetical protein PRZ48_000399 [Zasmidium cellare]
MQHRGTAAVLSTNTNGATRAHDVEPTSRTRYSLYPSTTAADKSNSTPTPTRPKKAKSDARLSRFREDMQSSAATTTTTTTSTYDNISNPSSSPPSSSHVNPAAIPVRTSSTHAVVNGDHTISPKQKSPKKHRSLGSVPEERRRLPEVDEREWMAQSRTSRITSPAPTRFSQAESLTPPAMIGSDLINGTAMSWSAEKENILKGPYDYLESHPGKDIRSQMISAFNAWLQVPSASLEVITRVVSMLHTSSLLIDDVEDNSQLRRGIPVAHSIFGTAQTINSANYVYFLALQELLTLDNPEVIRIYNEELLNLHRGQGMDLFWRDTLTCPTEDDYLEMVGNKTGGLFRLAIKLMCAESPSHNYPPGSSNQLQPREKTDYVPLVNTIGLLFQILDDYRNLSDTTYTHNKGLCEDLTEGKFSFPIIHAIRSDPSNLVLINILKQKTTDDEVKKYAVGYMERCGSFSYTRRILRGLTKKALALVDEVDAGKGLGEGIKGILERLRVDKHSRASASA